MALDEATLLYSPQHSLVLRFYDWAGPAATFGCHQSFSFIKREMASRGLKNIQLARRITGGGLVFHGQDLTFSIVFPWDKICPPSLIYGKIHGAVLAGLKQLSSNARLHKARAKSRDMEKICFSSPEPLDLIDSTGKKILGGALRRKNGKGLYQGSLQVNSLKVTGKEIKATVQSGLAQFCPDAAREDIAPLWIEEAEKLSAKYRSVDWNERIK
jgi:lipoate-protein ligase A